MGPESVDGIPTPSPELVGMGPRAYRLLLERQTPVKPADPFHSPVSAVCPALLTSLPARLPRQVDPAHSCRAGSELDGRPA